MSTIKTYTMMLIVIFGVLIGEIRCQLSIPFVHPLPVICPIHTEEVAYWTGKRIRNACEFRHYVPGKYDHKFWEKCNAN